MKLSLFSNSFKKDLKSCSTRLSLKVTSDSGDLPRIIEIALFDFFFLFSLLSMPTHFLDLFHTTQAIRICMKK